MLSLMLTRRFAPLFWCQFFSAFSDNFLKNALVFLLLYEIKGPNAEMLITLTAPVFIAPFFFLSAFGGEIADRFDKAWVAQRLKFVEIGVAFLAVVGFLLHSAVLLFLALFLFGVIAALFGPIKYGILPDHLQRSELPAGNALVEGATFIAILLGTIVGGLAAREGSDPIFFAFLIIVFSLSCWVSSLFIPPTGQAAPNLVVRTNIVVSTIDLLKQLREDARIWWGAIVTCWFWAVGGLALVLLPPLVKNTLGGSEEVATLCLAIFAISIAVGSGLAAWLAAGRIILLPTVLGAVLLGIFSFDLGFATWGLVPAEQGRGIAEVFGSLRGIRIGIDLAGLAIAGGLFIVPVFAAVQAWAGVDRRARVIAGVNVLNARPWRSARSSSRCCRCRSSAPPRPRLFMLMGVASLGVAYAIGKTMPASALSDALSIIYRALFRIEVEGLENLHKAGPNVIIALNHVSFLDAGLAMSLRSRKPVFAIDVGIAQKWWVKPFLKLTDALPLDPMRPMAVRTLIDAVKAGKALIIFPEGRITVTGSLMKVYDGAAMIADKADAEVIPVRIEGLEQTPFSRLSPDQVRRKWFPKVKVTVLEPVKLTVDPALKGRKRRQAAGAALYGIMSDLVFRTTSTDKTMIQAVVEAAERHGQKRVAIEDPVTGAMTYKRLLTAVSILGAKLMPLAPEGRPIGVMLPNANGAVVTILGLMSAGRVPAMINFTAGSANILAGCKAAEVTTIVTSRTFIEKGRLDNLVAQLSAKLSLVYLEDVRPSVTFLDKIRGLLHSQQAAGRAQGRRLGGDPVHVGLRGRAEGRRALPPQHPDERRAGGGAHRLRPPGQGVQRAAGVPLVRAHGRHHAAARLRRADLSLSVAAALPHGVGADLRRERHHHVRHRHLPQRLCARGASVRFPLAALHPGRRRAGEGIDAPRSTWRNSACASSKATASPRPRRCSRSTRRCSTSSAPSDASCRAWRRGWRRSRAWRRAAACSCAGRT